MTKLCSYCAEEIQAEAVRCKHCGSWLEGHPEEYAHPSASAPGKPVGLPFPSRKLTRSTADSKLYGVCGGIAHYLGVDSTLVRVAYALATFFTAIIPGLIIYIILACVIPKDGEGVF